MLKPPEMAPGQKLLTEQQLHETRRAAIILLLDQIDYISGNCESTEMVGGIIDPETLKWAREVAARQQVESTSGTIRVA